MESWQAHAYPVYALAGNSVSLFSSSSGGEIKEWDPNTCRQKTAVLMAVSGFKPHRKSSFSTFFPSQNFSTV
jgi:hypothetical protein